MVKDRPVVIISPKSRHHELVTVVPISTTPPAIVLPWHHHICLMQSLSPKWSSLDIWIKCDMINTFSIRRLDRFHHIVDGKRKYYDRRISDEDLNAIKHCISAFFSL